MPNVSRINTATAQRGAATLDRSSYPPVGIFISYSSENASLARKLKDKLEGLEDDIKLDVFISAELGGVRWRSYLLDKLAQAKILILCYTSTSMKLDWCSYELGRFHAQGQNHTICLINKNLDKPPDTISEWQAYPADESGLRRFFIDLFQKGLFTDKLAVNQRLHEPSFVKRLNDAVLDLEAEFAAYRVDEHYFPYRLTISSPSGGHLPSKLDFKTATVTGDPRGLEMFQVKSGISWPAFKAAVSRTGQGARWLDDLERAASASEGNLIPQSLSSFTLPKRGSFVPAISRIESFEDKKPWRISIIFVETEQAAEASGVSALDTKAMPDAWVKMLDFMRVALRFRWNNLEPLQDEIRRAQHPGYQGNWKDSAKSVFSSIALAETEMKHAGAENTGRFFDLFDADLAKEMMSGSKPYYEALRALNDAVDKDDREAAEKSFNTIKGLNSKFMISTLEQFQRLIAKLDSHSR